MARVQLNMQVLRRSRKALRAGDIFAYRLKDLDYGFGRVIRTKTAAVPPSWGNTYVVYFYRPYSPDKHVVPVLRLDELLLPPVIIGRELWTMGYFENVAFRRLTEHDVPRRLCFYSSSFVGLKYCDEFERRFRRRSEPCGEWGVIGYALLDRMLSEARGIAPHPDTIPDYERDFGAAPCNEDDVPKAGPPRRATHHTVEVRVKGPGCGSLVDKWLRRVYGLEDRLERAVQEQEVGWLDGNEVAMNFSSAVIFLYGKNADRLADVVAPLARAAGLPGGSYVLKRYGKGGAKERIDL